MSHEAREIKRLLEEAKALREALAAWVKVAQMAPTDSMEEWIRAHSDAMELTERAGFPWPPGVWTDVDDPLRPDDGGRG